MGLVTEYGEQNLCACEGGAVQVVMFCPRRYDLVKTKDEAEIQSSLNEFCVAIYVGTSITYD